MQIAKRIFLRSLLAILMTGALSGSGSASGASFPAFPTTARESLSPPGIEGIDRGVGAVRGLGIDFKSLLLETDEADRTRIPGNPEQNVGNAPGAGSYLLVIIGLGLIAVALWGKKRFLK